MGVYGFTKTGVGFTYKCMRVVGKLMWNGVGRLSERERMEKKVVEKGEYDDWLILDEVSNSESCEESEDEEWERDEWKVGRGGNIEMIRRIGESN